MVILVALAVLATVVLPHLWVRYTIDRHGAHRPDLPGTGGELARHLLDRFDLGNVAVEATELGDHYDPEAKTVRLLKKHLDGRSLAAVAIAAHEVSHALQDARGERCWRCARRWRNSLPAPTASRHTSLSPRRSSAFWRARPWPSPHSSASASRCSPSASSSAWSPLPVEIDASFSKALPILKEGNYVVAERHAGGAEPAQGGRLHLSRRRADFTGQPCALDKAAALGRLSNCLQFTTGFAIKLLLVIEGASHVQTLCPLFLHIGGWLWCRLRPEPRKSARRERRGVA